MKTLHTKALFALFMVLLVSGCAATPSGNTGAVGYVPVVVPQYQGNPYIGNNGYGVGNPYIRPAGRVTCSQLGNFVNCNSF